MKRSKSPAAPKTAAELLGGLPPAEIEALRKKLLGNKPPVVFAIPRYKKFARDLVRASKGALELGEDERKRHADGKGWHRYITPLKGREVILVGGTQTDSDQMELCKMGYNAWHWEAEKLIILMPYHGDARQERWKLIGESVDGAYTSMMLASIPPCPGGNHMLLVDIHADAITGMFIGARMRCRNITVLEQLIRLVAAERFGGKCLVAAPDAGRGKVVTAAARHLGMRYAIACKTRNGPVIETEGLIGDVADALVVLSDDIAVTFGSSIGAAEQLKAAGARDIVAVMTHGVIPNAEYVQKLIDSGLFSALYVTDSLPHVRRLAKEFPHFMHVVPLAPLLVREVLS